ncbi:MAG: hypothetical protein GWP10_13550 [Nitrospiraceae bacterium]|nr:hypothetical protein [Nitrospiraceae bacterium]
MLLFVYGSLKRGYGNACLLTDEHAEFIGEAVTVDNFNMISFGVPGVLIPTTDEMLKLAKPIVGELYKVSNLKQIDILEGHPRVYKRKKVKIKTNNNEIVKAWIYTFDSNICPDLDVDMDSSVTITEKGYEWKDVVFCPVCLQETNVKYGICQNCGAIIEYQV